MNSVERIVSRRAVYSNRILMSSDKQKINAIRNSLPKVRPPKYPHLAEKIEEIIKYFPINQTEISERTGIPQASISKCLGRKGSLARASLAALSTKLPEPIPLWWLMAGPDAGSLKDVLSKEKAQIPQPEDDDPEPTHVMCARLLERYFALAPDRKEEMTDYIRLMLKNVERQDSAARAKKRQSQAMTKNVTRDETTSNSP